MTAPEGFHAFPRKSETGDRPPELKDMRNEAQARLALRAFGPDTDKDEAMRRWVGNPDAKGTYAAYFSDFLELSPNAHRRIDVRDDGQIAFLWDELQKYIEHRKRMH